MSTGIQHTAALINTLFFEQAKKQTYPLLLAKVEQNYRDTPS